RGVPKTRYSKDNWYDVWLPNLSPSAALLSSAQATLDDPKIWAGFTKRYEAEMARPDTSRLLDALAALSHDSNFSVGCYCEDESRCHRSILRRILEKHGAKVIN